jgi:hypothetical protein
MFHRENLQIFLFAFLLINDTVIIIFKWNIHKNLLRFFFSLSTKESFTPRFIFPLNFSSFNFNPTPKLFEKHYFSSALFLFYISKINIYKFYFIKNNSKFNWTTIRRNIIIFSQWNWVSQSRFFFHTNFFLLTVVFLHFKSSNEQPDRTFANYHTTAKYFKQIENPKLFFLRQKVKSRTLTPIPQIAQWICGLG